ncbi:hypothetical protein JCM33374_g3605 [Metschnikowia sp. JCM 33374]|nr:hypothetical protein JCM33374_g3605 [Metschnikowia sp. JCM 33374]
MSVQNKSETTDVGPTVVGFSALSPYAHSRTVYEVVVSPDKTVSYGALSVTNRLQQVMAPFTARKSNIRFLNDASHYVEWYYSILMAFAAMDTIFAIYCSRSFASFKKIFHGKEGDIDSAAFHVLSLFSDFVKQFIGKGIFMKKFLTATLSREYMEETVQPAFEEVAEPTLVLQRENELFVRATNGFLDNYVIFMQAHGFDEYVIWLRVTNAMLTRVQGDENLKKFQNEWKKITDFSTKGKDKDTSHISDTAEMRTEMFSRGVQDTAERFYSELTKIGALSKKSSHPSHPTAKTVTRKGNFEKGNSDKMGKSGKSTAGAAATNKPKVNAKNFGKTVSLFAERLFDEVTKEQDSDSLDPSDVLAAFTNTNNSVYKQCSSLFQWDSGTSVHIVKDVHLFSSLYKVKRSLRGFNGSFEDSHGVGTVYVTLSDGTPLTLQGVHYFPTCPVNLISPFQAPGYFYVLPDQSVVNVKTGKIIGRPIRGRIVVPLVVTYPPTKVPSPSNVLVTQSKELSMMDFVDPSDTESEDEEDFPSSPTSRKPPTAEAMRWHDILGHPNAKAFAQFKKRIPSLKNIDHVPSYQCFGCAVSKATKVIPKASTGLTQVTAPFQILHVDVCGQIDKPRSWDNAGYFLTIVDRFSGNVAAFPIEGKDDASLYLKQFILESYTTLRASHYPAQVRSDNGGEFLTPHLLKFFQDCGTVRGLTNPYSSQQNGLAERMNQTLQSVSRTLLSRGNVPLIFWSEAIRVSVLFVNYMPRERKRWFCPIEYWFSHPPEEPQHLPRPDIHPFGCLGYAIIPQELRQNKLAPVAIACAYLGPALLRHGYRLFTYDPPCVFESGQVRFDDLTFYFQMYAPGTETYKAIKTKVPNALLPGISLPKSAELLNAKQQTEDRAKLKQLFDFSVQSVGSAMHPVRAVRRAADDAVDTSRKKKQPRVVATPPRPQASVLPPVPILPSQSSSNIDRLPQSSKEMSSVPTMSKSASTMTSPEKNSESPQVVSLPSNEVPMSENSIPEATQEAAPGAQVDLDKSSSLCPEPSINRQEPSLRPSGHPVVRYPQNPESSEINPSLNPSETRHVGRQLRPLKSRIDRITKPSVIKTNKKGSSHSHTKNLMSARAIHFVNGNEPFVVRILTKVSDKDSDTTPTLSVLLTDTSAYDLEHYMSDSLTDIDVLYATEADAYESSSHQYEIPTSYQAAMKSPENIKWKQACKAEMQALEDNRTWTLIPSPPGVKLVGCRWVFTVKDGGLYKARLVAKGYTQVQGLDFEETYSPVINKPSLRLLFALAAKMKFHVHQMDDKTAFLNGVLEEDIYMSIPPGFNKPEVKGKHKSYCLKLNKSLYGLKQAPLVWNQTIDAALIKFGFKANVNEPCLYFKGSGSSLIVLALYVDDMLIFGKDESEISKVKQSLSSTFQMKDLGQANKFLGINVDIRSDYIKLYMADYIQDTLHVFGLEDCNPNQIPWKPGFVLDSFEDDPDEAVDITSYRSIVGKIIYIAFTCRYDVAFYASRLSRYLTRPKVKHMEAAKSVLKYLKGTIHHGIVYERRSSMNLVCYSDADFASQLDAGSHSTTGFFIMFAGAPISWKSKLQTTIAVSTLNAEMIALYSTLLESIWLSNLLGELGFDHSIELLCDNDGSIKTANNQALLEGTKHVRVKVDFVRQKVRSRVVSLSRVDTKFNIADMLTKALVADTFLRHRDKSNMRDVSLGGEC